MSKSIQYYKNTLSDIQKLITEHRNKHLVTYSKLNCWFNTLMMMSLVLTPLAGLFATVGTILHPEDNKVLPLISAGISFLSGIIVSVLKQFKIQDNTKHHYELIKKYNQLNIQIEKKSISI